MSLQLVDWKDATMYGKGPKEQWIETKGSVIVLQKRTSKQSPNACGLGCTTHIAPPHMHTASIHTVDGRNLAPVDRSLSPSLYPIIYL
jgi:hypothetical protein